MDYLIYYLYDKLLAKGNIRSLQYIEQNYNKPLSVKLLAQIEHFTPSYYTNWFKRKTGYLPKEYILRLRMHKSFELLTSTTYPVSDIARLVGYESLCSFTRAFKKYVGLSPSHYRKTHTASKGGACPQNTHIPPNPPG